MSSAIYSVRIDPYKITKHSDIDGDEIFLFTDFVAVTNFCHYLRDLYKLNVGWLEEPIYTYDNAIQRMVEVFGPSSD